MNLLNYGGALKNSNTTLVSINPNSSPYTPTPASGFKYNSCFY